LPVGEAVATGAGELPARWVIHTVGPNRHRGQTDPELLISCFRRSLEVAQQIGARSVAFPAISAGVYGWDGAQVARIAITTVAAFAGTANPATDIDLVRFVLFNDTLTSQFRDELERP
ncbi:MAG: macro domain-containing protein, partial [Ornithinimicrobium sp.]